MESGTHLKTVKITLNIFAVQVLGILVCVQNPKDGT